jgi:hypothetical protein
MGPTTGNSAGVLANGKWERWKTSSTAVPLRLHGDRGAGQVFPLVAEEFNAGTRYWEELAAANRKFRNQGALNLVYRACVVVQENRTGFIATVLRLSGLQCGEQGSQK